MNVARLHAYQEQLKVEEIDEPKITGPHDVIVKIGGAGLCRTDLHIQEGQWAEKSQVALPYVPGHENAGWVIRTTARSVVKLDPVLHPKDIAALADAGLTAYHAVKKATQVLYPGTKVVVIGSGGLGHIGIQCLQAMTPAEIIVIDPSEKALALASELGADTTVKSDGKHVDTVLEMTDGKGADAVIDFVGERGATADGVAMLRRSCNYYVIGYGENIDVPTIDIISTEINFIGNLVGSYNDLSELMALTAQGKVALHTSTYPLGAVNDAMADLDGGRLQGRGILIPDAAAA